MAIIGAGYPKPGKRLLPVFSASAPSLGPELVTNGNFAQGSTSWTPSGAVTIANGKASYAAGGGLNRVTQTLSGGIPAAGTYRIAFTVGDFTTAAPSFSLAGAGNVSIPVANAGAYSVDAALTPTSSGFRLQDTDGVGVFSITNISFRKVG